MPKENTHLYFAEKLIDRIEDGDIEGLIKANLDSFYFGAVAPDVWFYAADEDVRKISPWIHGKEGNLTSELIIDLLDLAQKKRDRREVAFVLGFITHCCLDIVFHPMIIYITGNTNVKDDSQKAVAEFNHRFFETYLDWVVNDGVYVQDKIKIDKIKNLGYFRYLSTQRCLSGKRLEKNLKRFVFINRIIRSESLYVFFLILNKIGLFKKEDLATAYGSIDSSISKNFPGGLVQKENSLCEELISYSDIVSGEKKKITVNQLFEKAFEMAQERVGVACQYFLGKLSLEELKQKIPGESLETGRVGVGADQIKYFVR